MPQINRIRVNNVKYNFGTQFYDDFLMRFNCKNTIYDLANGGGKSLLMLLLMQNMIPNCTLDEKQPIDCLLYTSSSLYQEYNNNAEIYDIVHMSLKKLNLSIYEYNNGLYVSAGENNRVFGYTNEELRKELGIKVNKDLYMAYFVIYNIITEFYTASSNTT